MGGEPVGSANGKALGLWDPETQEVHGGQTWRLLGSSFVEDFSVTTNAFGAPQPAVEAARAALGDIHHYPAADCGAATAALAEFTRWPESQLLLGNGASEFIDLVMRVGPPGGYTPGPFLAAYMEYSRAAKAAGREVRDPLTAAGDRSGVTVIIRPNSPTGDFMGLDQLEQIVKETEASPEPGIVVMDESFMAFHGPSWREHSALELVPKYPNTLMVICSWTKLWSCPGLRLGSIACGPGWYRTFKKMQTPWSCNTLAQEFCRAACNDTEYMQRTWSTLPAWKTRQEGLLTSLGWVVNKMSPSWVPWVFVNCGDAETAAKANAVAMEAGCPVRLCASFGIPTYLRLGVRAPEHQDVLQAALEKHFGRARD
eukprot:CAMPEP_0198322458 /NCGR_PEP_ID=MMETSP1450-20131203/10934_1 /TAXON_ID=753684 ORGANISM="Madagascaria erythrocladiodes, Strain CCMP3234" /NCGR_SAMPLE_ID=MMETSP1450 /ASSEMBLY_ACC=CAM_ASM_001115 /LENGTH=369 /DNA_ID=CAMNT_0044026077 /DNA_START=39 /DNA_END=1148 /DNA_ORIENTATION=-